jgi:hypothetical protein
MGIGPNVTKYDNAKYARDGAPSMFSRAEREFLRLLSETPSPEVDERIRARFPNPVYRRKLRWGIRRKASAALSDWTLYHRAVEQEARLVPPARASVPGEVPVVTEPFAALGRLLTGRPRTRRPSGADAGRSE